MNDCKLEKLPICPLCDQEMDDPQWMWRCPKCDIIQSGSIANPIYFYGKWAYTSKEMKQIRTMKAFI